MKQRDDYICGPHHYRVHFWCGLVFGAAFGAWVGWNAFNGRLALAATSATAAGAMAYSCGRWGDRAWEWVLTRLDWFW